MKSSTTQPLSGELIGRAWGGDSIDPQEVFDVADLLDVRQCDILQSCAAEGGVFIPRFYMLHVWLFNANNRCGIFWGTHEDISVNDLAGVDPASIPDESSSFILQAADDTLYNLDGTVQLDANGDPIPNKNYRKMCLDPSVTAGMTYDGVKQYIIQANMDDDDDVKQTLVCPTGSSATGADDGCRRQQRDQYGDPLP